MKFMGIPNDLYKEILNIFRNSTLLISLRLTNQKFILVHFNNILQIKISLGCS